MNLTPRLPDDVATRLGAPDADLERDALEALVLEKYRAGQISMDDVRRALGFEALDQVDGFLKAHGVYEPYTVEDINRQVETLARLGY
jgi:hypothetical protein